MQCKTVATFVALIALAHSSNAATVWNPAANPDQTSPFLWSDAANWTNDVPGVVDGKAVFNVPGAAESIVADAQSLTQFVQGDNGEGGIIRVQAGGSLSTGPTWSSVGYNNTARLIVEQGGVVSFGEHAWIGFLPGANGVVDINGGVVNVAGMFGLGWEGGNGYVNVNDGGLLALSNIHGDGATSIKQDSLLNIVGSGAVTLPGDFAGVIENYAANGLIAGNGVPGAVEVDLAVNEGFTTITALAIPEPVALVMVLPALGVAATTRRR